MNRKVLKPWVEKLLSCYVVISVLLLCSLEDFTLLGAFLLVIMCFMTYGAVCVLNKYGRGI